MPVLQIAYHPVTKVATVQNTGATLPSGAVNIGSFNHPDLTYPDSYVIFHGIRELLYKRKPDGTPGFFPDNMTDMEAVTINNTASIPLTGVDISIAGTTIEVGETRQLTALFTPANATNKAVTYASSFPAVATVSNTGLITGVADGNTEITVTTTDGGFTKTVVVSVFGE